MQASTALTEAAADEGEWDANLQTHGVHLLKHLQPSPQQYHHHRDQQRSK
jgi:hypothetical protein